ncbi:MAG: bifunctional riboflavin kinase/FAD synthetase [Gammaproteobacteria bacterium]
MLILRGVHHRELADGAGCALTIGNFDGVHRGHQAMLALLTNEARHRGLPSCVLTFEPHPRDHFAALAGRAGTAPARIATLRDKLSELRRCGIDRTVVLRFDRRLAALSPEAFVDEVLVRGLKARYVLVGDDFRFGARRAGDYALLDASGARHGFDVARMMSYEVHGLRVSSSAVRQALADGDMAQAAALLGRPYTISGHVVHGRKLGRALGESAAGAGDGFRTLNLRFGHPRPAAGGIFVVRVLGLGDAALPGVASLGVRPTVEDAGRVLLEVHCLTWPPALGEAYGRVVQVELLHKLHDERRYASLDALREGIAADVAEARCWWAGATDERVTRR